MKRGFAVSLLVLLFATFTWGADVRIVRLSYVSGDVQLDSGRGQGFDRAILNLPVVPGARLVTQNGEAEVEFEDGNTIRLAPDTSIAFTELGRFEDGALSTRVSLNSGTAYFDIQRHGSNEFRLALP